MEKNRRRILHGMNDIAGQGSYSVKGLREIGADANLAVWERNQFGYPVDIDLKIKRDKFRYPIYTFLAIIKIFFFAVKAILGYDIFHFHAGGSLLPYGLDLPVLKALNKRIIMEFHGNDIRYVYNRERPQYYPYKKLIKRPKRAKKTIDRIIKYADSIITHDEELRKHIPCSDIYITPLRLNIDEIQPIYPDEKNDKVLIVHASSNYIAKGSKYVINSIESLKNKYNFEFILVEHKTQEEAIEIYKRADIIIDQLFYGTYGVFAIEAMALGKPVISYISDEIKNTFPDSLPIVSATIDNLTDVLKEIIQNGELRKTLGIAGRKYVEMYHDYRKVAQVQMKIYINDIKPMGTLEAFEYTNTIRTYIK